jgi:hypothetical protein
MTRLGITIDYSDDFATGAKEVVEFERVGADVVSVPEAYSFDAPRSRRRSRWRREFFRSSPARPLSSP